jgi:hypothetical protein
MLDQHFENGKCLWSQWDRLRATPKTLIGEIEPKWPERDVFGRLHDGERVLDECCDFEATTYFSAAQPDRQARRAA